MRPWLGWIAIALLLSLAALALAAYGTPAKPISLNERVHQVAATLSCPVCGGESVADSSASISNSMRHIIREQLIAGRSGDSIRRYFALRYGDSIVLSPPSSGLGGVAWYAPALLVLGGIGVIATLIADWRTRDHRGILPAQSDYVERVRNEIAPE